jgi:hypothetical protein
MVILFSIGVKVKVHLDLGDAPGGRGDSGELKLAENIVVLVHGSLPLIHLRNN